MNSAISHLQLLVLLIFTGCTGQLQQFVDEDKPLVLSVVSNTAATPTYSVRNGTISFSITLQVDRTANYSILHGSGCSATRQPAGVPVTGSLTKNSPSSIAVSILLADISTLGNQIAVCVTDVAAYQSASAAVSFASAISYLDTLNEQNGGGLTADATSAFQIFQADAVSGSPNRGTTINNNTASWPYYHAVFIDRNDGHKMKYFVADRNNHRVLIFNGLPTGNTATADAVLGQTSLTAGLINAGGGATISAQGFNEPCGVAVRNSGEVLVVDRANNRVVIFASVPTSLGTWNAYRVIGQPNMASGTANNFSVANGGKLNDPSAVHVIDGKIYIADRNNHRILVFNSLPTSDGASADLIIGQPDASTVNVGTDYATSSSYLNHPYEVHKSGNQFFVADGDNNRVLIYNAVPSVADTRPNMVLGQAGSTGGFANRSGPVAANTLYLPVSVAVVSGKLAIADQNNHRLLFYDFPLSNGQAASYVLGQSNFLGSSFGTTASKYKYPKSFVIDNGYIWVADIDNNRIQVMQLPF